MSLQPIQPNELRVAQSVIKNNRSNDISMDEVPKSFDDMISAEVERAITPKAAEKKEVHANPKVETSQETTEDSSEVERDDDVRGIEVPSESPEQQDDETLADSTKDNVSDEGALLEDAAVFDIEILEPEGDDILIKDEMLALEEGIEGELVADELVVDELVVDELVVDELVTDELTIESDVNLEVENHNEELSVQIEQNDSDLDLDLNVEVETEVAIETETTEGVDLAEGGERLPDLGADEGMGDIQVDLEDYTLDEAAEILPTSDDNERLIDVDRLINENLGLDDLRSTPHNIARVARALGVGRSGIEPRQVQAQVEQVLKPAIAAHKDTIELQLHPPEWGKIRVQISVDKSQVNLAFLAEQLFVKEALDKTIMQLRQGLESDGLNLGDATVDVGDQPHWRQEKEDVPGRHVSVDQKTELPNRPVRVRDYRASVIDRLV